MSWESITDNKVHLTNNAVQKKDPEYQSVKEELIQIPASVGNLIESEGEFDNSCADYMRNEGNTGLDHDIKRCMVDVLHAGKDKMNRKHGYFDLLGFDFMV